MAVKSPLRLSRRRLAAHFSLRASRWCWNLLAASIVTLALLVTLVRFLLPQLEQVREHLSRELLTRYGIEMEIGQLGAQWQRSGPHLLIHQLKLPEQQQLPLALTIEQVDLTIDFWRSLWQQTVVFGELTVSGVAIDLSLDGNADSDGFELGQLRPLRPLLLDQLEQVTLRDIRLNLRRDQTLLDTLHLARWDWRNQGARHLGQGQLYLDGSRHQHEYLSLSLELQQLADERLHGRLYLAADALQLGPLLARHWPQLTLDSTLNLQGWLNFTDSALLQAQLQLDGSAIVNQQGDSFAIDRANLLWLPTQQGWQLRSDAWQLRSNDYQWQPLALQLEQQADKLTLAIDPLPLAGLLPLATLVAPQSSLAEALANTQAQGQIGPLAVTYQAQQLQAQLPLQGVGWRQHGELPGLSPLDLQLQWQDSGLHFSLPEQPLTLDWPQQFAALVQLQQVAAQGRWYPRQNSLNESLGSALQFDQVTLVNADLEAALQGVVQLLPYRAPWLQLSGNFAINDAAQVRYYLPQVMGSELASYLGNALQAGATDDGKLLWHAPLDGSNFTDSRGRFLADFTMQALRFEFLDDWPAATDATVLARFDNALMDLDAKRGMLADLPLHDVDIVIPELGEATVLEIDGAVVVKPSMADTILKETFLASSITPLLQQVQPQQPLPLVLDMRFPLGDAVSAQLPQVNGTIAFDNAEVWLAPLALPLRQVTGQLQFSNEQVIVTDLQAQVLHQPTTIQLQGGLRGDDYGVDIDFVSDWQLARLPVELQNPITDRFSGASSVIGEVDLLVNDSGLRFNADLHSKLNGVSIDLPPPFNKTAASDRALQLWISGDDRQAQLSFQLGQQLAFNAPIDYADDTLFARYLIQVEPTQLQKPTEANGLLLWQGDTIALQQWQPLVEELARFNRSDASSTSSAAAPQKTLFAPLTELQLSGNSLQLFDLDFGVGSLVAQPSRDGWQLSLDSQHAKAEVQIGEGAEQLGVAVEAEFLHLPNLSAEAALPATADEFVAAAATAIEQFPALQVNIADLRFGQMQLGPLSLLAVGDPQQHSYRIEQLQLGYADHQLNAQGLWYADGSASASKFTGGIRTKQIDALMSQWGLEPSIQQASGELDFNLQWAGAPWQFTLDNLNGDMSFELNSGHLKQVGDKGARLLSLFSLESLMRKLALDFSDVFGEGMHFDEFSADVKFNQGIASTNNGLLDGGAGKLRVDGWTNLPERTLDYHLRFSPALTSSLPAVMYLSTGALTMGLGALAVTTLLEPVIEVITQLNYRLSGSLDDPQLEETERLKREVEVRQGQDPNN
ncbi:YhdP family protein [Ferrimonas senticii]|uniref:YhdP family protein n=1 Tax=Ferrimonas senticii TaxID=394566 RepID=UPI000414426D|nr:YhdP family protein [Ferrimonas senticii]